jgi:phenylacetic acid degradation operon negative regulatory protein
VTEGLLRPRSGSSAKALLLTVLGEFLLPRGGSAWTQTLVAGLRVAGVEEKNARQAIARVGDQGLIIGARTGRRVRWTLTPSGADLLTAGTERIFQFGAPTDDWDGRWLVVLSSVPEDQRAERRRLRSRLAFAGFGFVGAGLAITPHLDREALANEVLKDLGLVDYVVVLRAEIGDLVPASELLNRAWDLDGLGARYRAFIRTFSGRAPATPAGRFAALVELVHEWRRFPFLDPELPAELLDPNWPGRRAKALFDRRHEQWAPQARAYFEDVERSSARG